MKESSNVTTYRVLGVMSGTSLDGLDLALVDLTYNSRVWSFNLISAQSVPYSTEWIERLGNSIHFSQVELDTLDQDFGKYIGQEINKFLRTQEFSPDFIASHGHTVLHQPEKGITLQVGSGQEIHAQTKIPVINDFRSEDVRLGGEGAPLVPMGDRLLFSEFDYCINLGGIANISFERNQNRIAFDICPINMALNYLVGSIGVSYDKDGQLAMNGSVDTELLAQLGSIPYLAKEPPKSLGLEDFLEHWKPILDKSNTPLNDKLNTFCEHAAIEISRCITSKKSSKVLVTGGGAFNPFFIARLNYHLGFEANIPSNEIIEFKEAIVFSLLGVLRFRNEPNCLSSVTGASTDNCGGEMYGF